MASKRWHRKKGQLNELRSKKFLEARGYACARSSGSLGAWDIIGVSRSEVILVQVKTGRPPGRPEMDALIAFEAPRATTRKVLHIWYPYKKEPRQVDIPWVSEQSSRSSSSASNSSSDTGTRKGGSSPLEMLARRQ